MLVKFMHVIRRHVCHRAFCQFCKTWTCALPLLENCLRVVGKGPVQ